MDAAFGRVDPDRDRVFVPTGSAAPRVASRAAIPPLRIQGIFTPPSTRGTLVMLDAHWTIACRTAFSKSCRTPPPEPWIRKIETSCSSGSIQKLTPVPPAHP